MNFDFLVFPSPKCSYSKEKLGDQLVFIPKYIKIQVLQEKAVINNSSSSFNFSKNKPLNSSLSFLNFGKSQQQNNENKSEIAKLFSQKAVNYSKTTSLPNSQRRINVKIDMTNYLQNINKKNDDEEQPTTPLLTTSTKVSEEKPALKKEIKKNNKSNVLTELESFEQRKSFFLHSKNDFEEGIDNNWLSSPKKILNYRFKESQSYNPFKMNSPRVNGFNYKSPPRFFEMKTNPKPKEIEKIDHWIPCLYLDPKNATDKIMIYFHGNAEDIYLAYELLYCIHSYLKIKILAVEYPGYGLYKTHKSSSQLIQEDAVTVYDYLHEKVGYEEKNIILLGRSIGSGPASYLASIRKPGALVMMSSFLSLKSVVKDHVGGLHNILKERFNNYENIKKVKCPCFFVHGLQDKLISYQHSQKLHDACAGPSELCLPKEMTHSEFCFDTDFIIPLENFLKNFGFEFNEGDEENDDFFIEKFKFPEEVYKNITNI